MTEVLSEFIAHGVQCMVARTSAGVLVGYAECPAGHPWNAIDRETHEDLMSVEVHGGITWFRSHTPWSQPGHNKWLGFDTAHCGDYVPFAFFHGAKDKRWSVDEVTAECTKLARQIAEAAQ